MTVLAPTDPYQPTEGRCNAKTRNGTPCARAPVPGRTRCKLHGGASLRGTQSPTWKGRGYSKDLPTRYADRMQAFESDEDLIRLGNEMRLLDARIGELFADIPRGEAGVALDRAQTATRFLVAAIRARNQDDIDKWAEELEGSMADAEAIKKTWGELYGAMELRRKLADTERKRIELHESTMTAKEAQAFFGALQIAILDEVHDPEVRLRLAKRIELLLINGRQ